MRIDEKKADWLTIADDYLNIFLPKRSLRAATFSQQHTAERKIETIPPSSALHLRQKNNSSPSLIACQILI